MGFYRYMLMLVWGLMLTYTGVALETSAPLKDESYKLEFNINVVGAEAAANNLSAAMLKVSESVNQALQSDKLNAQERQALLEALNSFQTIKDKFKLNLSDARAPINNIMADTRLELNKAALDLNNSVIDPVVNKFEMMFYILLGLVVFLVLLILVFIKFYILASINRVSSAADNLGRVLDALPQTMKAVADDSNRQLRFKRKIMSRHDQRVD